MSAVNTIATYVFWNHHEETKGKFVWSGNRNLRRFIELCKKHHMYVILRVGPFAHGEVRNGGLPDWLYGMPFELRSNNEEYLYYVDRLYKEIELQARGLLFKDGGPIIAVQIENEYMHVGAPWEMTNGISNEWITSGNGGERHMIKLKELAKENGLDVPIYTCTAWGGAMTVFYNYRFKLPYKSVVAMANIKLAGGCNFLGYYVYHGGSNPKSENGAFMNEHATPKISYDYQATLGEFGQVRDSYRELKLLHYFVTGFSENLCPMKTFLPERAEKIDPKDIDTLRYAIRAKDNSGFIFINNFQDHVESKDQTDFKFNIKMKNGEIVIPKKGTMNLKKDCSCILPYNLNLNGINLEYSTTQLITTVDNQDKEVYFFFIPEGMTGTYYFNNNDLNAISMHEGNYLIIDNHIILEVNDKISYLSIEGKKGRSVNLS